jgi:hypothetical protein
VATKLVQISVLVFSICFVHPVWAGSFNFGLGFEFVDATDFDGDDFGLGLQLGYEIKETEHWNIGVELDLFDGVTDEDDVTGPSYMAFDSQALYLTARPYDWFLQFKAGAVRADYERFTEDAHDIGLACGLSLVFGSRKVRFHLLDVQHYIISGDHFNSVAVSVVILLAPLW